MQRIMILGAGAAQIPLIQTAKAMGYETVVATIPGPYPGIEEADIVSYTDITDCEGIAAAAKELGVCAIATCCLETGLKALAYACKTLGLPGITPEAAEISVNKLVMKQVFRENDVLSARFRLLKTHTDLDQAIAEIGLPLVVKAVDLQGSKGVYVVNSAEEAHEALTTCLRLTKEPYCLAEEFISGENIGAEAFVQNGRVLFVLPDGTISHKGHVNIPMGHFVPLDRPEAVRTRICREVEKSIRACGFDHCAVNVDLVLHGDEPYIIELTARAGATCLPELVSIYYGVDYYRLILMAALGQDTSAFFETHTAAHTPAAATMLTAPEAGIVRDIRLPAQLPETVYDLHFIVKPGDEVRPFAGTIDRIGQIIVSGQSVPLCMDTIRQILAQITIEVEHHD